MPDLTSLFTDTLAKFSFRAVLSAAATLLICLVAVHLLGKLLRRLLARTKLDERIQKYLLAGVKLILYIVTVLIVAESLNIPMTSLVALLSVGSLGVTLAAEDILGNVAGGLVILSAHPFSIGDYVEVGGVAGTVHEISLNHTKLVTPDGHLVMLPNKELASSQMTNYTVLGRRRVVQRVTASYDAPTETVKAACRRALEQTENLLGSVCRAAGYDEIITYSFISPTYYDKIDLPKDSALRDSLKILNPLGEDTSIMRTTTLPSMLEILTRNYNFRNKSAKLYELGRVYFKRADGLADEPKVLTLGAYGDGMDFFALKGAVEAVLKQLRIENVRFLADSENPSYHPGRCAKVFSGDRLLGVLGQIHPHVAGNYGVDAELYAAELRFDALYESKGSQPLYQPLPKFPAVTRDIAVVCDASVTVGELEDAIRKGAKGLLKDAALFDIYTGTGIAPGKKSVAFNLTLRADDRSLTAEEADADVKSILTALEQECGAVLR